MSPWRRLERGFARRVAPAGGEELGPLGRARTRLLVRLIFRLMPMRLDRRRAREVSASFEWQVALGEGRTLLRTLSIREGRARVRRRRVEEPDVRIEVSGSDFLRLATGAASGPELFFGGRLRVSGNFALALALPELLRPAR